MQYYRLIAQSLTTSAQHIACHMYHIDELTSNTVTISEDDEDDDGKEDEKNQEFMAEATGQEEFFLVDFWCKADPPLVLLNQHPLRASSQITRDFFKIDSGRGYGSERNYTKPILRSVCDHFKEIQPENDDDKESMIDAILKYAKDNPKRDYMVYQFYQEQLAPAEEKKGDEPLKREKTDVQCDIVDATA
eukprot:121620_1